MFGRVDEVMAVLELSKRIAHHRHLQTASAAGKCHLHPELALPAGRHDEYTGLFGEIPGKADRVCDAMPGLDTNEGRAGFAPEAEVRRIRKMHGEPGTCVCSIPQALAANGGEDHRIVGEELVI